MQLAQSVSGYKGRAIFCQKHLNPKVLNILKRLLNNLQVFAYSETLFAYFESHFAYSETVFAYFEILDAIQISQNSPYYGVRVDIFWFGWLHSREVELLLSWVVHP